MQNLQMEHGHQAVLFSSLKFTKFEHKHLKKIETNNMM
jgi:hypothetical protein